MSAIPQLLALDLDGTTLAGGRLLPEDIRAARALRERGVGLTILTGRLVSGARWVAEALGIDGPIALMNGSIRYRPDRDRIEHEERFRPDQAERIATHLDRLGLRPVLFEADRIHIHHHHARYTPYLRTWTPRVETHGIPWSRAGELVAVGTVGPPATIEALRRVLSGVFPTLRPHTFDTFEGTRFLELRASLEDKGTALRAIAAYHGVPTEQVAAVGDWWNDLPMLEAAGQAYAMAGSTDDVLDAADRVLEARRGKGGALMALARLWGIATDRDRRVRE